MAIPNPQVAATSVSDQRLDIDGSTWQLNSITNESVTLYTLAAASGTSYKIGYLAERPATANFTGGNAAPTVAGKTLVVGLTNINAASKFHVDYDRAFVVFDNSVSSPVNVTYSGMGSIQRAKDINESLLANEWAVKTSGTVTGTSEYSAKKHATDAATSYTNFRNDYLGDYANDSAANAGGATVAVGSLYFNTTTNKLKVCTDASGTPVWANATSAVEGVATITEFSPNGTASHFAFSHDVGLQIVWLNGVRLIQGTDYLSVNSDSSTSNMTSGTASHIYFASVPQSGDVLSAMGFGTVTSTAVVPVSGGTFTGNVAYTGNIQVDDIIEKTSAHGVEIEQVTLKDGGLTTTGNVGVGVAPASNDGWGKIVEIGGTGGGDLSLNHSDSHATQGIGQVSFTRDSVTLASVNGVTGTNTSSAPGEADSGITKGELNFRTHNGTSNATRMTVESNGNVTVEDGDLVIGTAGHGITFQSAGGTGTSNTANSLDDYEIGSFTATCANSVTLHSNLNTCSYTKIGELVTVRGQVRIDSTNGGQAFVINNLPFQSKANIGEDSNYAVGAVRLYGYDIESNILYVICQNDVSSNSLHFVGVRDNVASTALGADQDGYVMFSISYTAS